MDDPGLEAVVVENRARFPGAWVQWDKLVAEEKRREEYREWAREHVAQRIEEARRQA